MFTFENPSAGVSIRAASRPIILYTEKKIRRNIFEKKSPKKNQNDWIRDLFCKSFQEKNVIFDLFYFSTFFCVRCFFQIGNGLTSCHKKLKKVLMKKMTGCDHKWIQEVLRAIVPISATKPWLLGTGLGSSLKAHFKATRNVGTTWANFP